MRTASSRSPRAAERATCVSRDALLEKVKEDFPPR
jgi:hypothetical protein